MALIQHFVMSKLEVLHGREMKYEQLRWIQKNYAPRQFRRALGLVRLRAEPSLVM
jgi:hypothetical protein